MTSASSVRAIVIGTRSIFGNCRKLSTASIAKSQIKHRPNEQVFALQLNSKYATVEYEKHGNVYDLTNSIVPDGYEGKGYGTILAEKTFDYIANENLRMKISCSFLMDVYKRNETKYKQYYAA